MGVLLISHDLSVVAERCESISVMRQGAIVEAETSRTVSDSPPHPFTAELLRDLTHLPETTGNIRSACRHTIVATAQSWPPYFLVR